MPRSLIFDGANIQAGPKLHEDHRSQPFGEDVGKLWGSRNMENTDSSSSNTLPNKVKVNLNMFGAFMLDKVWRHVDSADVITIDQSALLRWSMQLEE